MSLDIFASWFFHRSLTLRYTRNAQICLKMKAKRGLSTARYVSYIINFVCLEFNVFCFLECITFSQTCIYWIINESQWMKLLNDTSVSILMKRNICYKITRLWKTTRKPIVGMKIESFLYQGYFDWSNDAYVIIKNILFNLYWHIISYSWHDRIKMIFGIWCYWAVNRYVHCYWHDKKFPIIWSMTVFLIFINTCRCMAVAH